jgi:hypothetical protein
MLHERYGNKGGVQLVVQTTGDVLREGVLNGRCLQETPNVL